VQSGDEILQVNGVTIGESAPLIQTLHANTSSGHSSACSVSEQLPVSLLLRRGAGDAERELVVSVMPAPRAPLDYGFGLRRADFIYSVSNPLEAVAVGCKSCVKFLQDSWLTLEGIITKRVPSKNVGGPIAIGVIAHTFASVSWTKFFFFLCVLSMNLAFLNVLPIPLLDGGHLFFLLIEKLKGSPVSDRVMGYSQLAGLALIGFVFIYILYQDLQKAF